MFTYLCINALKGSSGEWENTCSPFSICNYLLLLVYKNVLAKLEFLLTGLKTWLWDWSEGTLTVKKMEHWECLWGPGLRNLPRAWLALSFRCTAPKLHNKLAWYPKGRSLGPILNPKFVCQLYSCDSNSSHYLK